MVLVFALGAPMALAGINEIEKNKQGLDNFMLREENEAGDSEEAKQERERIREEMQVRREEVKAEAERTREEARQRIEALKTEIKTEKDQVKAKIMENRIVGREKALERFDTAIVRITEMKDRVNVFIDKLAEKDLGVPVAEDLVLKAEEKLAEANTKIDAASAILAASIDQLTEEDKTKLRTLAQETQTLLKEAHQYLIDAVKSLKDTLKAQKETTDTEEETDEDNTDDSENNE